MHEGRDISLAAVIVASLALIGPAGAQDISDPVQAQLYEAAKAEGTLVWYGSTPPDALEKLITTFEAKFPGLDVEAVRASGVDVLQRFTTEKQAGVNAVDVLALSEPGIELDLFEQGMIEAYKVAAYDEYPEQFRGNADVGVVFDRLTIYGPIVYNTDELSKADIPSRIADFATLDKERFTGKVIMNDPRGTFSAIGNVVFWEQTAGDAAVSAIAALEPVVQQSSTVVTEGVTSGEYWLSPTFNMQTLIGLKATGAPIDFVVPEEGVWAVPGFQLLVADAPHPNAAKLWLEWLYSKEGQDVMASLNYPSGRPDVELSEPMSWLNGVTIADMDYAEIAENCEAHKEKAIQLLGLQ